MVEATQDKTETDMVRLAMVGITEAGGRAFRNNTAMGWGGKSVKLKNGDVLVKKAIPIHAGLAPGSADIIAIMPVVITPDMVGKTIGVFVSPEMKTKTGPIRKGQEDWRDMINLMGGRAAIVRSPEDAVKLALGQL